MSDMETYTTRVLWEGELLESTDHGDRDDIAWDHFGQTEDRHLANRPEDGVTLQLVHGDYVLAERFIEGRSDAHDVTTRTYAVPTRHAGTAQTMVHKRTGLTSRVVGTGSTDPDTGKPEVLVEVRGDSRAHSDMLAHFAWMGW